MTVIRAAAAMKQAEVSVSTAPPGGPNDSDDARNDTPDLAARAAPADTVAPPPPPVVEE